MPISSLESARIENSVELTTTNTRSMRINTKALREAGVTELTVDGESVSLDADEIWLGPQTGKKQNEMGPLTRSSTNHFA